jgi:hypothetical protein
MKVRESEMPTDSERGHVHLPARESSDEAYHKMEVTTGKTDYVDLRNMSPLSQKLLAVLLVTSASTSQPRGSHPFPFYALSRGHRLSILQTAQKKKLTLQKRTQLQDTSSASLVFLQNKSVIARKSCKRGLG